MSALSSSLVLTLRSHRLVLAVGSVNQHLDHLSCRFDGRVIWEADTASWRALSVIADSESVFFWSARHLVGVAPDGSVRSMESGEDIVAVFADQRMVVVIGESSVRLHRYADLALIDRVELRDVADGWELRESQLDLKLHDGTALRFLIRGDRIESP